MRGISSVIIMTDIKLIHGCIAVCSAYLGLSNIIHLHHLHRTAYPIVTAGAEDLQQCINNICWGLDHVQPHSPSAICS